MTISESDLENKAKEPKKVRTDEGFIEERSVDELIKADRYKAAQGVLRVPFGMTIARTKPNSTTGGPFK